MLIEPEFNSYIPFVKRYHFSKKLSVLSSSLYPDQIVQRKFVFVCGKNGYIMYLYMENILSYIFDIFREILFSYLLQLNINLYIGYICTLSKPEKYVRIDQIGRQQ